MSDPNAYVMLLSSLPRPMSLFAQTRTPLSRLKLESRLRVLAPEDAEVLRLVEQTLHWGEMPISMTDEQIVARARAALEQIENETIRLMVRDRLEQRTCMVALRRRHRGEPAPARGSRWGIGRWLDHIARHWTDATFALSRVFPWLGEADRLLKQGDSLALQRLILEEAWKTIGRRQGEHEFDFEAVIAYVLRWDIIERWSRYDGEAAAARFEELTEAALADHAALFEGEPA